MPKINREEYEILKGLDDKWKWIARDEDSYYAEIYQVRPYKAEPIWFWDGYTEVDEIEKENLFQFIKWEDEEPYNIQELIEEYEKDYKGSWEHAIEFFGFDEPGDIGGCEKCGGEHAEDIYYHESDDLYVRIGSPNIRDSDLHTIFIEVTAEKTGVGTTVDVNYCPFCGANLKERYNYVKHRE